jgi:hypothetical protein
MITFKQHFTEATEAQLLKKVTQWKKDLRRMTKLYRSLKAEDTPKALKAFKQAQKAFIIFSNNWEKWYQQELLQRGHLPVTDRKSTEETYYQREVREKAWKALMDINGLFPTDYFKGVHTPAPWNLENQYGETRKTKITRYNKSFNAAFKAIEDLITQEFDQINALKKREQLNVAGINVLITGITEQMSDYKKNLVDAYIKNLHRAVKAIKKSGFKVTLKGLTLEIALGGAKASGVQSGAGGAYDFTKDWVYMFPIGMNVKDIGVASFVHELGHRYWYRQIPKAAREDWKSKIASRQIQIKKHHIIDYVDRYYVPLFLTPEKKFDLKTVVKAINDNEKDPSMLTIMLDMAHNSWYHSRITDRASAIDAFDDKIDEWIDLEFISEYGKTKPNEAFAEVFRKWVGGRKIELGPWTRQFFKDIVRTGGANIRESKIKSFDQILKQ